VGDKKMKMVFYILFLISILSLAGCSSDLGKYDTFAKCLTEKGLKMYGTEWCSHCKNQKVKFGNSFKYIKFIDCDKQKSECTAAGIQSYPTWSIRERKLTGEQQLYTLGVLSGCKLIKDNRDTI